VTSAEVMLRVFFYNREQALKWRYLHQNKAKKD
jgi:hypothetical protein